MNDVYESKLDGTTETETLTGDDREALGLEEAKTDALMALADTAANLSRAVQTIAAYVPTQWVDNSEPSINATRLMHIENGIRDATAAVNNAINAIAEINGSSFMPRSSAPNSAITESTNIDNIKIPGSYTSQGANIAGERRWGNFAVFNDGNYYIVQEFTNDQHIKLIRVCSNGEWGNWFSMATKGDLVDYISKNNVAINMNYSGDINSDSACIFGFFSGNGVKNAPVTDWFQWISFPMNRNTKYPLQIGYSLSSGDVPHFWMRCKRNESWSGVEWKEIKIEYL